MLYNDNTENLESISKKEDDAEIFFTPVNLDKEDRQEFENLLFPTGKSDFNRSSLTNLSADLVRINYGFNCMKDICWALITQGAYLEDIAEQPEEYNKVISEFVSAICQPMESEEIKEVTVRAAMALTSGSYIIQESSRYNGGKDLLLPQHGAMAPSPSTFIPMSDPNAPGYELEKYGSYDTPLSKRLLKLVTDMYKEFMGSSFSLDSAHKVQVGQVPLNIDLEKYFKRLVMLVGDSINEHKALLLPGFSSPKNFEKAQSVYSLGINYMPSKTLTAAHIAHLDRDGGQVDNGSVLSVEGLYSAPLSFSLVVNLKEKFVNFISQSESGELSYYCLRTWSESWSKFYLRPARSKRSASAKASRDVPRFILPNSLLPKVAEKRKNAGFSSGVDKVSDDSLFIDPTGRISFLPKGSHKDLVGAKKYEQTLDDIVRLSSSLMSPVPTLANKTVAQVYRASGEDNNVPAQITTNLEELSSHAGALLSYDWDLGVAVYAQKDPTSQRLQLLAGSTTPDALAISDYLGYDFSEQGERPQFKRFIDSSFRMLSPFSSRELRIEEQKGSGTERRNMTVDDLLEMDGKIARTPIFQWIVATHRYLSLLGKVPSAYTHIANIVKDRKISNLADDMFEVGIYEGMISAEGKVINETPANEGNFITEILVNVMRDAQGEPGTNLFNELMKEMGGDLAGVRSELPDHPRFFHARTSTMAQLGNIYNYLGGEMFRRICEEITKVDTTVFQELETTPEMVALEVLPPRFDMLSSAVLPSCIMYSKYVPNYIEYFKEAENTIEEFKPDSSIGAEDILCPGLAEGSQFFPHQVKTHKVLRQKPKFAILDIAPGGGKTITVLTDIMACQREDGDLKPLVICPNGLVSNWCDDLNKVTKGTWNAVPLTTDTINDWGLDALEKLFETLPRNTIFIAGISAISNSQRQIELSAGNGRWKSPLHVEFLKKFNFNYCAVDECHKAKNPDAVLSNALKAVTTVASMRYLRLATGTLVSNTIVDIVGQAALMSPHMFGTKQDFEFDNGDADGPSKVRSKLANYAAVITMKRKEWAFMLPSPIDSFIPIEGLDDPNHIEDAEMGNIHKQAYDIVLNQQLGPLEDLIKKNKEGGLLNEEDDDELSDDDKDSLMNAGEKMVYAMVRVEQMIINPHNDEIFWECVKAAGIDETRANNFVPAKATAIIKRIKHHFEVAEFQENKGVSSTGGDLASANPGVYAWRKGITPAELDKVDYEGNHYLFRRFQTEDHKRRVTSEPSNIPPNEDPARWKVETKGKLLIFCRFIDSASKVYNLLPPKFKAMAREFHGKAKNKWDALDDFKNKANSDVQILCATEQAITEGHNLQVASRIIRVEAPWTPGDYDQATARIFRPDVAAATEMKDGRPGDMGREVINTDWLMVEGTMEVQKIARLMWKTIDKVKFDEKGNHRYDDLMDTQLEAVKMSASELREYSKFDDYREHFQAKGILNNIEAQEFHEMRETTAASMVAAVAAPTEADYRIADVLPINANQEVSDPHGLGMVRMLDWVAENASRLSAVDADPVGDVKGMCVVTSKGKGIIVSAKRRTVKEDVLSEDNKNGKKNTGITDPNDPFRRFVVRIADASPFNAGELLTNVKAPDMWVVPKLLRSSKHFDLFKTSQEWATKTEKDRLDKEEAKAEAKVKAEMDEKAKAEAKAKRAAQKRANAEAKAKERKANTLAGTPDKPVKPRPLPPVSQGGVVVGSKEDFPTERDKSLRIIPSMFNGFLALHANMRDPDAKAMKEFGFTPFTEYAYIEFKRANHFMVFLEWLDDIAEDLKVDDRSIDRLADAYEGFSASDYTLGNKKLVQRTQKEMLMFFRNHRKAKNERVVRFYPVFMGDSVRVCVDIATSPRIKNFIGKRVPKANAVWKLHEGMMVNLVANKQEAKQTLKAVIDAGYKISNLENALTYLKKVKIERAKGHNDFK